MSNSNSNSNSMLKGKTPIHSPRQIEAQIKEQRIKCVEGAPLSYRYKCNADGGKLQFETYEDAFLSSKGKPFSFCPISFRAYHNRKFGRDKAGVWIEVYFLNEKAQTCMLMFNNASAEQFLNVAKLLTYEDLDVSQVRFNCTPKVKNNAEVKSDYFVCCFEYEELDNEERELHQIAIESLPEIYRRDTLDKHDFIIASFNYPQRFLDMLSIYSLPMGDSNEAIAAEFEEVPNEAKSFEEMPIGNVNRVLSSGKKNR